MTPLADSLFISLSTYPEFTTNNYLNAIDFKFNKIKNLRCDNFNLEPSIYTYFDPIYYHMWGIWDLCTLSAIDSSLSITEILQPETKEENLFNFNHTKLLSGILYENLGMKPNQLENINQPFISITNLKISNKWLIGNGLKLLNPLYDYIKNVLIDKQYYIILSYSSYELTLVIFGDDITDIYNKIVEIRELCFYKLKSNLEPLYSLSINNNDQSNIFSDSNTLFGLKYKKQNSEYELYNTTVNCLSTWEIEIKPSYLGKLKAFMTQHEINIYTKPGRYDIYTLPDQNKITEFINNRDFRNELKPIIRRFKTNLLFNPSQTETTDKLISSESPYKYPFDYQDLRNQLESLKVSKSIRNQLLKMFYNFKNQVNDTVNLNLFLDILPLLEYIKTQIKLKSDKINSFYESTELPTNLLETVNDTENMLREIITVFEEAYFLRYANDHSIEEVPDFLLHNSQFQTIATSYDNLIKSIASSINGPKLGNILVTSYDDSITIVNKINIKLSTYNLFEPGIIICLISKEILTLYISESKIEETVKNLNTQYITSLTEFIRTNPTSDYIKMKEYFSSFNIEYLFVDFLRFKIFFKDDFELFYYWHLGNLLQFPGIYGSCGEIKRHYLYRELLRIILLIETSSLPNKDKLKNTIYNNSPNFECLVDWQYYFNQIYNFLNSSDLIRILELNQILKGEFEQINSKLSADNEFKSLVEVMINFLIKIKSNDSIRPSYLGRNWKTGKYQFPFCVQKSETSNPYFLFDPQGGIFFYNFKRMEEYTIIRNEFLLHLYDLSCNYKKKLFINYIQNPTT